MANLAAIAQKIRSKNAGPFWLTVDIFCGDSAAFSRVCAGLSNADFAGFFQIDEASIKRFEIGNLKVLKFSIPRPQTQGSPADRDIHGASWAALIGEIDLT